MHVANTRTNNQHFTSLVDNNSLKLAKEYAESSGQADIYKKVKKIVHKYSKDNLKITVRKNKKPEECFHITILNKTRFNKFLSGIDYMHSGSKSIGEVTFGILKELADTSSKLYKKIFNK